MVVLIHAPCLSFGVSPVAHCLCTQDFTYSLLWVFVQLCDACSDAVHTDNMLAARHTIVPAAQALATEAPETLTKEDDTTDALSSVEKPLTTTGSEAVVPSLSDPISAPNVPNEMDKGIFGKDSFGKAGDIAEVIARSLRGVQFHVASSFIQS